MFNGDLEVSVCKPDQQLEGFYRNGEGDEVLYIHRGGVLRTVFGMVPFQEKDCIVAVPAGHAHVRARRRPPGLALLPHPWRDRNPKPVQPLLVASRAAPTSQRDFRAPSGLETWTESGEFQVTVKGPRRLPGVPAGPAPVRRRSAGTATSGPRVQRRRLRACGRAASTCRRPPTRPPASAAFAPRMLDWDPGGDAAVPPLEHPVRGGHVPRRGRYAARKESRSAASPCTRPGSRTGQTRARWRRPSAPSTDELAIMWDTFRPLRLTALWRSVSEYALSWNPDKARVEA